MVANKERKMKPIDEDYEAWERYPQFRSVFNKLELSLKLGYNCGPACVPVTRSGMYIIRPIYNLYGMSVSARFAFISRDDKLSMENHKFVPPGHFWCEAFEGSHYSIDYRYIYDGKGGIHSRWEPINTTIGEKDGLQFTKWTKIKNKYWDLPNWLDELQEVGYLNIEFIDDKIIEIHLRTGHDIVDDDPIGTEMIPIWKDTPEQIIEEYIVQGYTKHDNPFAEVYDASGYIENPRIGYLKNAKILSSSE